MTTKVHYRLVAPITDSSGERLESVSVWRPEEKGSDVKLGSRLLNDAWSDAFDVAAVLTTDSDLTAPIRLPQKLRWLTARWFVSLWGFEHLPDCRAVQRSS